MFNLDSIYLGVNGMTGTTGQVASEVYVDNLLLVPEPATWWACAGLALAALSARRRRIAIA